MARTAKATVVKRGDPVGGKLPVTAVRLPAELINRIDVWAGEHDTDKRSDAIRKLVELGLSVKRPRIASGQQRDRAAALAGRQIDQMGDTSATYEEKADRKRRLTEGPSVFREVRRDRSRKKAVK